MTKYNKTEFFYPRISNFKMDSSLTEIYLDSFKNYGEIIKIADKIACNGKIPLLKFNSNSSEFNLIVFKECISKMDIVDYHGSNVISIEKDSIIINDNTEMSFDSLRPILQNHILNPNREFNFSKSIDKAIIFYYQDSLVSSKKIKKQLIKITTTFNDLNRENGDSLPLKIKLSEYPYIRVLTTRLPHKE
jgi:hypothetical protein